MDVKDNAKGKGRTMNAITSVDVLMFKASEIWNQYDKWFQVPEKALKELWIGHVFCTCEAGSEEHAIRACIEKATSIHPEALLVY